MSDEIGFHATQGTDVLIELVYDPAWPTAASPVVDSVLIHIPEPMTMALLGLGGLGLLRRRRN